MDFLEVIEQARDVLQRKRRITYRTLKRQFALDDDALEDLKDELIKADRVARDEDGEVLVWIGEGINGEKEKQINGEEGKGKRRKEKRIKAEPDSPPPSSYTPQYLAERFHRRIVCRS